MGFSDVVLGLLGDTPDDRRRKEVRQMGTLAVSIRPGESIYVSGSNPYLNDPEDRVFLSGSDEIRYHGLTLRRASDVSSIGSDGHPVRNMRYEIVNK